MAIPQRLLTVSKHSGDMTLEGEDSEEPTGDGSETNKRSERKRQREKQRRFDLSNAFDELAAFIAQVEPGHEDIDLEGKKKRKKSGEGEDSSGITRLDLIGRALKIMKRLHRENEERKRILTAMQERGGPQGPNDNVSEETSWKLSQRCLFSYCFCFPGACYGPDPVSRRRWHVSNSSCFLSFLSSPRLC
jgi:hypothetical protein